YRSISDEGGFELIHIASSGLTYQDNDLDASTTYFYKVRAIGANGESEYSDIASALTNEDDERPSPVVDLTRMNNSDHNALLSWSPSTDNIAVTGYNIYRRLDGEDNLLAVVDEDGDAVATSQIEG